MIMIGEKLADMTRAGWPSALPLLRFPAFASRS